jgi:putative PIN family toxin of toxin-antitoxin system
VPIAAAVRAVIDTNVLVSALFWRGPPHTLLEEARSGVLTFVSSSALLAELDEVLREPKFRSLMTRLGHDAEQVVSSLRQLAEIIDPPPLGASVSRDRDDDALLALAIAAHADMIVSGDADLLVLKGHLGIPIVAPSRAVAYINASRQEAR